MLIIKSKENNKYKYVKSLLKSKYRNKERKYIAEGLRTVMLAIEHNADIDSIFMSESFRDSLFNDEEASKTDKSFENIKKILTVIEKNMNVYCLSDDLLDKIAQTENTQGIIAVINMKSIDINDFDIDKHKKIVILDRVSDPGNIGTIIRTADASGYDLIFLTKGCVDIYNPKVVRSSMGSIFYMDIISSTQEEILKVLKNNNVSIVSSYLNTDNYFNQVKYKPTTALVLGNEANGICEFWIKNSDTLVKIPMFGKAESFNVAISSGILMYYISTNTI